jgi:predicted PP-loop superfamily ATPase
MSMYTQLLEAAFGQYPSTGSGATGRNPLDEVLRYRRELEEGVPKGVDPDTVPVVLALQIGYDVALLELARRVGIDSDPSHFEQPHQERERLEIALRALGISVEMAAGAEEPVSEHS